MRHHENLRRYTSTTPTPTPVVNALHTMARATFGDSEPVRSLRPTSDPEVEIEWLGTDLEFRYTEVPESQVSEASRSIRAGGGYITKVTHVLDADRNTMTPRITVGGVS